MKKTLLTLALSLFISIHTQYAQSWVAVNDTFMRGGDGGSYAKLGNKLLFGSSRQFFRSTDNGGTWQNTGFSFPSADIECLGVKAFGNTLYSTTYTRDSTKLYSSSDTGLTWQQINPNGLSQLGQQYWQLGSVKGLLFITGTNTSFASTDGINWTTLPYNYIFRLTDSLAYVNQNSIYLYTLDGQYNYDSIPLPSNNGNIQFCAASDTNLIYMLNADNGKLYRTDFTSLPVTWQLVHTFSTNIAYDAYMGFYASGKNILVWKMRNNYPSVYSDVYQSSDHGTTWQTLPRTCGLPSMEIYGIDVVSNDTFLIHASDSRIYRTCDGGSTWKDQSSGYNARTTGKIVKTTNALLVKVLDGYIEEGILRSTDNGLTWHPAMNGIPPQVYENDTNYIVPQLGALFAIGDTLFFVNQDYNAKLYKSLDEGVTWQYIKSLGGSSFYDNNGDETTNFLTIQRDSVVGGNTFTYNHYFKTADYGNTWVEMWSMFNMDTLWSSNPGGGHSGIYGMSKIVGKKDTLVIGRYYLSSMGTYQPCYSTDGGNTWQALLPLTHSKAIDYINIIGDNDALVMDFSSTANAFMASLSFNSDTTNALLNIRTDSLYWWQNGVWSKINATGLPGGIDIQDILYSAGTWYLTSDKGVYESIDNGNTWSYSYGRMMAGTQSTLTAPPNGVFLTDIKQQNGVSVLATKNNGCWRSTTASVGVQEILAHIRTNELEIIPNPAVDQFTIVSKNADGMGYVLIDCYGKVVRSGKITEKVSVSTSGLASGMYFLRTDKGDHSKVIICRN